MLKPVLEVLPERDAQFTAGFLQAGKCIPALSAGLTTNTAADFPPFDILADGVFGCIVVQRNIRTIQD